MELRLSNFVCSVCGAQATMMCRDAIECLPEPGDTWKRYRPGDIYYRCDEHARMRIGPEEKHEPA